LIRTRDGKIRIRDLGWKKVGSGINIPDPVYVKKGSTVTSYIEKRKFDMEIKTEGKKANRES
jgi:hypothetical protein